MNKLGLYVHVPFCRKKCAYCDFYSACDPSLIASYEKALCRQIASLAPRLSSYEIDTVYFGGGTPSLLSPKGVEEIFTALRQSVGISSHCEITLEANPDSCTEEVLETFRKGGANRISLGMQSANEEELSLLGRIHTVNDTRRAVELSRQAGFDNLSLDLMYGLPRQTKQDFMHSLSYALSLGAEHLSFYLLTLSEDVPLYQKVALLPDDDTLWETYRSAVSFLEKNGFCHYEISNAAKPGRESRHNLRYWQRSPYFGLGPGAYSFFEGERFSMPADTSLFLLSDDPFSLREDVQPVTREDAWQETVMLSLRLAAGLDLDALLPLAGQAECDRIEEKLLEFQKRGLCRRTERGFALTTEGFFVSNTILTQLI